MSPRRKLLKMRHSLKILALAAAGLLAVACGGNKKPQKPVSVEKNFPDVAVPAMFTEPDERLSFLLEHFWDGLTDPSFKGLCDTSHVQGVPSESVEEKFGAYATMLWMAPVPEAAKSVSMMFDKAEQCEKRDTSSNVFETLVKLSEKYLYDPNSPVRNEEFYLPFVQKLANSECVSENMRPAYGFDASMCALNRIGTKAADFSFKDLGGKVHTLYGIKSEYTLLFFSNPGCPNCREITEEIENSPEISNLEKEHRLSVVNVYIDQELDKWRAFASEYPKEWICGYDHNYLIRTDVTYNVRAIPSLYLLDKDKVVIFKDAPQDKVFEFLIQLAQAE